MVYIHLTGILTVILCIIIFGTGNIGLYITFRGHNINAIKYRSSFVVFLGYYYISNYLRILYIILSFFVYNSDLAQCYIIYTQCVFIFQPALLFFMAFSRFFAIFKSNFNFSSLAFTNMLTIFMLLLIGLYALTVYVFKIVAITAWVGLILLLINLVSAVISLLVIFSICCVRNFEKRQQIKLAFISFFMAAIYLIQYAVTVIFFNNSRGYYYYGSNFSFSTYTINGYNINFYSFINSMGLITISAEIITLLGSCILYFLFRPQQSNRPLISTTVVTQGVSPVGPLMT